MQGRSAERARLFLQSVDVRDRSDRIGDRRPKAAPEPLIRPDLPRELPLGLHQQIVAGIERTTRSTSAVDDVIVQACEQEQRVLARLDVLQNSLVESADLGRGTGASD